VDRLGSQNKAGIESLTVDSSLLEKILSVSDRRIRQLADEGILVRVTKGKYDLVNSLRNYIRYLKLSHEAEKAAGDMTLDYDLEHAKNERVKRMQNELKFKLMKGELHKAAQIEMVVSDMLVTFRNRMMVMLDKLTPMLLNQGETGFVKRLLEKEIYEALNALKNYNAEDYYDDSFVDCFVDDLEMDGDEDA